MKNLSLVSALLLFLFTNNKAFAQNINILDEDRIKKITVTGSAEIRVVPDEIYVNFTLQEYYNKQKSKIWIRSFSIPALLHRFRKSF